jgi:hypothetical protein
MSFDNTQRGRAVQIFCGPQKQIWVILENAQRRVATFAQHAPNIIGIMAMIYRKLVLLKLERLVTNSAIIPLELQKKLIICGG